MSLRAAGIETYGAEVTLLELPEPPPLAAGEVLIEVRAAGAVTAVGDAVDWPAVGTAVMTHPLPLLEQGCWAERLVAPAHLLAAKPDTASWAAAAAFPVPALTAEQGRVRGARRRTR